MSCLEATFPGGMSWSLPYSSRACQSTRANRCSSRGSRLNPGMRV